MEYSYWHIDLSRHGFLNHCDTFLRSIGAAFFCTHPISGVFFLCGLATFSPRLALFGTLGAVSAQITATLLKRDEAMMKVGFFSFNGALVGMYWCSLNPVSLKSVLSLAGAAALTVPLMMLFNQILCLSRFNLPPLSLASLIVTYPSIMLLNKLNIAYPPTQIAPPGFTERFSANAFFPAQNWFAGFAHVDMRLIFGAALMLIGTALHSRKTLFSAVKGIGWGLAIAIAAGGMQGVNWISLYLVTTTPIAIALDGFFLVSGRAARWVTRFAMVLGAFVWFISIPFFEAVRLPELTIPFCITTLFILFLSHLRRIQRWIPGLKPVPLLYVISPEAGEKWAQDLETAHRYWHIISPEHNSRNWEGDLKRKTDQAVDLILNSHAIVAFTGAGVSTESNIPDFRTGAVHWKKYDTRHFVFDQFAKSEESRAKYWEMSQDFYLLIKQAKPNRAHLALTQLERMGKLLGIITQNVDRLHSKAGISTEKIVELHGNELFVTCLNCGKKYTREEIYEWILNGVKVPYCLECQGILKPDSIAFGQPMQMSVSRYALDMTMRCDLMIIMGTSLLVQPAALLPWKAKENGAKLIIINLSSTVYDEHADVLIRDRAGKAMGKIMDRIERVRGYIQV